jgi:mannosyltransferase OCH1-like enzyme
VIPRRTSPTHGGVGIAEDDSSRSQFICQLMTESGSPSQAESRSIAPRVLVQFWDEAEAPRDVQQCLESWAAIEAAGFERMLFDDASARDFIQDRFSARHVRAFDRCDHPAMRADYFRLCFMLRVGGLYVDADDEYQGADVDPLMRTGRLLLQALCFDISSNSMIDVAEALADGTSAQRIFYVNNNPLVAGPGHPVIAKALERSTTLLLATRQTARDIQSVTGPGNLTASLVAHAVELEADSAARDFEFLMGWEAVAVSKWPLDYRGDGRNWRNWIRGDEKRGCP